MIKHIDSILNDITERLKPIGIEKLILFGSYAYGTPNDDSDIDLLVVTNDNMIPQTFAEKSKIVLQVNRLIRDIKDSVPVDLIVHTRAMHNKFIKLNSLFCREILTKGKILHDISS